MRRGKPSSFGWLLIGRGQAGAPDLWEAPTGYQISLDKGVWLEEDEAGFIRPIEPPALRKPESA